MEDSPPELMPPKAFEKFQLLFQENPRGLRRFGGGWGARPRGGGGGGGVVGGGVWDPYETLRGHVLRAKGASLFPRPDTCPAKARHSRSTPPHPKPSTPAKKAVTLPREKISRRFFPFSGSSSPPPPPIKFPGLRSRELQLKGRCALFIYWKKE